MNALVVLSGLYDENLLTFQEDEVHILYYKRNFSQ